MTETKEAGRPVTMARRVADLLAEHLNRSGDGKWRVDDGRQPHMAMVCEKTRFFRSFRVIQNGKNVVVAPFMPNENDPASESYDPTGVGGIMPMEFVSAKDPYNVVTEVFRCLLPVYFSRFRDSLERWFNRDSEPLDDPEEAADFARYVKRVQDEGAAVQSLTESQALFRDRGSEMVRVIAFPRQGIDLIGMGVPARLAGPFVAAALRPADVLLRLTPDDQALMRHVLRAFVPLSSEQRQAYDELSARLAALCGEASGRLDPQRHAPN